MRHLDDGQSRLRIQLCERRHFGPALGELPAPYANVLSNPAYTTFKSNWAWANLTDEKNFAVKGEVQWDPAFITDVKTTITAGARYAGRDVDQTFGRYLINGTVAGGVAGSCGNGLHARRRFRPVALLPGSGILGGAPTIPVLDRDVSNPDLALTVNNFGVGNIIVKNPDDRRHHQPVDVSGNRYGRAPACRTTPSSSSRIT